MSKRSILIALIGLLLTACQSSPETPFIQDDQGWALVDEQGNIVLRPYLFDNGPDYFEENLARFVEQGKIGFFNRKEEKVIAAQFDFASPFRGGLAAVCTGCIAVKEGEHERILGGKWRYINQKGTIIIPLEFDTAEMFNDGKAQVQKDGRTFFIDNHGREIEP